MGEHTPGPWRAIYMHGTARIGAEPTRGHGVAVCKAPELVDQRKWVDSADARLIAAAPDLLAALKTLKKAIDDSGPTPAEILQSLADVWDEAEAAIAKAEGHQ